MAPTRFLTNKQPAGEQKLRGGYYTPVPLARYLCHWAIRSRSDRILEPSCGDGNFVIPALETLSALSAPGRPASAHIVAVEIDASELSKARARARSLPSRAASVTWTANDFFAEYAALTSGPKFDVVLGNPPFIRFQYFNGRSREHAFAHLRALGYAPTKLANAWSAFVQLSLALLRPGGRLAMVLPAELLQVGYASQLRDRLATAFSDILLIAFERLVFPHIQQEVVLLLAEGKRPAGNARCCIRTLQCVDGEDLFQRKLRRESVGHVPAKHSRNRMKWTALFLSNECFDVLSQLGDDPRLARLGDLASVEVGIVTGRNSFFVLTKAQAARLGLSGCLTPIIGRTSELRSIRYTETDYARYQRSLPSLLLNTNGIAEDHLPGPLRDYIAQGLAHGVNLGYKCRIRRRWFDVPSVYSPTAFMFRQIHTFPLIVVNDAGVTSTDTIHRVLVRDGIGARKLAACALNSLTLAWAEVCGRSYGGGVLELEPNEAEDLPVPYTRAIALDVHKVDQLLRRGRHIAALDYVDAVTLRGHLGLSTTSASLIRDAWEQLRDRRANRR